jgi:hypothetical protein
MADDLIARVDELLLYLEKVKNVDVFTCDTGAVATLFVHINDDFLRISTTVPNYNGKPAVGTVLDRSSAAYTHLLEGESYSGFSTVFGRRYFGKYIRYFSNVVLSVALPL